MAGSSIVIISSVSDVSVPENGNQSSVKSRENIRDEVLSLRKRMDGDELARMGSQIAKRVLQAEWYRDARCIHCFSGAVHKGEIPTLDIVEDCLKTGKILAMPRVSDRAGRMVHVRVTAPDHFRAGPWGIMEPVGDETVPVHEIELVLVPGLAADPAGNRIGYGKGYYDRFLGSASHALKVMLIPERFVLDRIPAKSHDIPMDFLVTESRILYCRS
jgi:5-formyltetrahydrofolate cyclo-ligase